MSLQQIYDGSQVLVQHLMASVSGCQRNQPRHGRECWSHSVWLEKFDTWVLERRLEHQSRALVQFLTQAAASSNGQHRLIKNNVGAAG